MALSGWAMQARSSGTSRRHAGLARAPAAERGAVSRPATGSGRSRQRLTAFAAAQGPPPPPSGPTQPGMYYGAAPPSAPPPPPPPPVRQPAYQPAAPYLPPPPGGPGSYGAGYAARAPPAAPPAAPPPPPMAPPPPQSGYGYSYGGGAAGPGMTVSAAETDPAAVLQSVPRVNPDRAAFNNVTLLGTVRSPKRSVSRQGAQEGSREAGGIDTRYRKGGR